MNRCWLEGSAFTARPRISDLPLVPIFTELRFATDVRILAEIRYAPGDYVDSALSISPVCITQTVGLIEHFSRSGYELVQTCDSLVPSA